MQNPWYGRWSGLAISKAVQSSWESFDSPETTAFRAEEARPVPSGKVAKRAAYAAYDAAFAAVKAAFTARYPELVRAIESDTPPADYTPPARRRNQWDEAAEADSHRAYGPGGRRLGEDAD